MYDPNHRKKVAVRSGDEDMRQVWAPIDNRDQGTLGLITIGVYIIIRVLPQGLSIEQDPHKGPWPPQ